MNKFDPATLPKGGLNSGIVIPLKCNCPTNCSCGAKKAKEWHHEKCMNPSFITENGDILCKNHLGQCSGYFIKDAKFMCENSRNYEQFTAAYQFLMALGQTMQSASYKLSDQDQVVFSTKLTQKVMQRWFT